MSYNESHYNLPICNHREGLTEHNVGYSIGITDDGVPFEAEMHVCEDILTMNIIMPSIFENNAIGTEMSDKEDSVSNLIGFRESEEMVDYGILDYGMVDNGEEDDMDVIQRYVDFLLENEIISYASNVQNGTVQYRVDIVGNDLTKVIITMMVGEEMWAYTDLTFRSFQDITGNGRGQHTKVIDFTKYKNKS